MAIQINVKIISHLSILRTLFIAPAYETLKLHPQSASQERMNSVAAEENHAYATIGQALEYESVQQSKGGDNHVYTITPVRYEAVGEAKQSSGEQIFSTFEGGTHLYGNVKPTQDYENVQNSK